MKNQLWICPAPPPGCISDGCPHVEPHEHEPSCKIACGYCDRPCIKIEEEISMEINNKHEAKAFYIFLNLERKRHQGDIDQIDKDLKALTGKWGFYFTV